MWLMADVSYEYGDQPMALDLDVNLISQLFSDQNNRQQLNQGVC